MITSSHAVLLASGFNPLTFDPAALVLTWLTFLGLLVVLGKVGWKPMLASIEAREKRIDDSIKQAEQDRHTAGQVLAEYKERVKGVEAEVAALKEKGRQEADKLRQEMLARAESEVAARSERALKELDMARAQALEDLRKEAVSLGMAVASKLVGRSLEGEDQRRLAAGVIDDMSKVGPKEN